MCILTLQLVVCLDVDNRGDEKVLEEFLGPGVSGLLRDLFSSWHWLAEADCSQREKTVESDCFLLAQ